MKTKVIVKSYEEVKKLPREEHLKPIKQTAFWRKVLHLASVGEVKAVNFTCDTSGIDAISRDEPALFLMNHSSFTDLQICAVLLKDRQYHIVMTNDGMVGKSGLMRRIGCIPTRKFIMDLGLIRDMQYCTSKLNSSILMYPEASYSFDGTETPLPESLGKCIKLLKVPVVMIRTTGAFLRDPLYNNLQKRDVKVSAKTTCLLTREEVAAKSAQEINDILKEAFRYDHFREQVAQGVLVKEDFRADGLERALYKCSCCGEEGAMVGKGITLKCEKCGDTHELLETGLLQNRDKETRFPYVSDWYAWQRQEVKKEIEEGSYRLKVPVRLMTLVDYKSMYEIGEGVLEHSCEGFKLTGCDGQIDYSLSPKGTYSLYADYFWYEIGDLIAIGDGKQQFYCFPKEKIPVAKARIATEELYKFEQSAEIDA